VYILKTVTVTVAVMQRFAEQDLALSHLFTDGPEDLTCYRQLSGNTSSYWHNFLLYIILLVLELVAVHIVG